MLVEDWCQQYPSHSIGTVEFGADGALYASGGDGASFNFVDWGQDGIAAQPVRRPSGGLGATLRRRQQRAGRYEARICGLLEIRSASTAQSSGWTRQPVPAFQTTPGRDPPIPMRGALSPTGFAIHSASPRPGTDELWIGDVGWNDWEEINRVPIRPLRSKNFGWPCYEGNGRQAWI